MTSVTILYAYRNRELSRIKASLDSLKKQTVQNFKVEFVDYGSDLDLALEIKECVESYPFAHYHYIPAQFLLWNKSKALNYGIQKASTPYVFIADVDLLFHPNTTAFFEEIAQPNKVNLFKLAYLDKNNSSELKETIVFEDLKPKHFGQVNGMVLVSKAALEKVKGYDTFFHFYGSEDVDLYGRLENAGYEIHKRDVTYFYHIWHRIYNSYNDKKMDSVPRLFNIKRINEQHYLNNVKNKVVVPYRESGFGKVVTKEGQDALENPDITLELENIHSHIHHFFYESLQNHKDKVVWVIITEAVYSTSIKYRLKKMLNRESQPYISMKAINDIMLARILYDFRDHNYSYKIESSLKQITFKIKL